MKFINRYNNDNFNKKLASLINFNNNDSNSSNNNDINNYLTHTAAGPLSLLQRQKLKQLKQQEEERKKQEEEQEKANANTNTNPETNRNKEELPSIPSIVPEESDDKLPMAPPTVPKQVPEQLNDELPTVPPVIPEQSNDELPMAPPTAPKQVPKKTNPIKNESFNKMNDELPTAPPIIPGQIPKKTNPSNPSQSKKNIPDIKQIPNIQNDLSKNDPFKIDPSKTDPSKNDSSKSNSLNITKLNDELPTFPLDKNDSSNPSNENNSSDLSDKENSSDEKKDNTTALLEEFGLDNKELAEANEQTQALLKEFNTQTQGEESKELPNKESNEITEEEPKESLQTTQENVYNIDQALAEMTQNPEKYLMPFDEVQKLIEEENNNPDKDDLAKSNEKMNDLQNEKISEGEEEKKATDTLIENGVSAVITYKDQKLLDSLNGKVKLDDTKNDATGTTESTDATEVMKNVVDIMQNSNLISESPDVSAESIAKQKKDFTTKDIQKLNTSAESRLQVANNKITTNPLNDIINEFTNPEELKQYILQQCDDKNRQILTGNSITNLNTLKQAVSAIYRIAFNNKNFGVIESTFTMNIKDIVNKFITNLYVNMFNDPEIKGNNSGHSIGTVTNTNVHTFISERFDRTVARPNGIDGGKMYPFYTPLNGNNTDPSRRITLYRLVNACALKFCLEKQNKELHYDSTKTLDDLSTDQLFILKTAKNKNKNLSTLTSTFANAVTFSKADTILKKTNEYEKWLRTYINNYTTQLKKLVSLKQNIKAGTLKHHQFERMSWKGFDEPLNWYDAVYNVLDKSGQNPTYRIPEGQRLIIRQFGKDSKITKENAQYFGGIDANHATSVIRSFLVTLYKTYIVPRLLEDINRLIRGRKLLERYQFVDAVYNQLYTDLKQYTNRFFYISPFFNYTEETMPIEWFDQFAIKNQQILEKRKSLTAKRLNNRILIRLATNYNNDITDNDLLAQFFQQPYAKYMIGLLCGTHCLTKSNARTFEDSGKKNNIYLLDAPKMQTYITKYLNNNKSQLETLQSNIINITKTLLQNKENLINILPEINLLEQINNIDGIDRGIKGDTFTNDKDIFETSAVKNSSDFIGYFIWRFSKGGCKNNLEYKRNLRRYILQPRVIDELKSYVLEAIRNYQTQLEINKDIGNSDDEEI